MCAKSLQLPFAARQPPEPPNPAMAGELNFVEMRKLQTRPDAPDVVECVDLDILRDSLEEMLEASSESTGFDEPSILEALCVIALKHGGLNSPAVQRTLDSLGWTRAQAGEEEHAAGQGRGAQNDDAELRKLLDRQTHILDSIERGEEERDRAISAAIKSVENGLAAVDYAVAQAYNQALQACAHDRERQHTLPGESDMAGALPVQGARVRMGAGADGGSVPLGWQGRRQKKGMECAGFEFEGGEGKPVVLKRIDTGGQ